MHVQPNSGTLGSARLGSMRVIHVQHRNRVSSILSDHSLVRKTRALNSKRITCRPCYVLGGTFLPFLGPSSGSAGDAQSFPTRLGVYSNHALASFVVVLLNLFRLVHPLAQRASLDIDGLDGSVPARRVEGKANGYIDNCQHEVSTGRKGNLSTIYVKTLWYG